MTSHGCFIKQNEISQQLSMETKILLQKKLLYSFKSSFIHNNKNFDASATLNNFVILYRV